VLWHGEIVEWGERESVLSDPRHPYTRRLREATPGGSVRIEELERQDWLRRGMDKVVERAPRHWARLPVGMT
jgi:ABC-type dipeptide/oligopeptide/nickel transport system ATPase component